MTTADRQKVYRLLLLGLLCWTIYYLFSYWIRSGNQIYNDDDLESSSYDYWDVRTTRSQNRSQNQLATQTEKQVDKQPATEIVENSTPHQEYAWDESRQFETTNTNNNVEVNDSMFKVNDSVAKIVKEKTKCNDVLLVPHLRLRQPFWVYYNYLKADVDFGCSESVTLTANCEYNYLDNVIALAKRWKGPISISVYAPGRDFEPSLRSLLYLRQCQTSLIKKLVTFHVFFDSDLLPDKVPSMEELQNLTVDCTETPPYLSIKRSEELLRVEKGLPYYINVARNIARESVQTYFVFPVDVELYPSPNISINFLNLVARKETELSVKRVYPVHIFEVQATSEAPTTKAQLRHMLNAGTVIPFHKRVCSACHGIPMSKEWLEIEDSDTVQVQAVGKRLGSFSSWEPIYIGTQHEPLYDERLTWDGMSDKIVQSYILCNLDYEFAILDNGFLVHKPGIKTSGKLAPGRGKWVSKTNGFKAVIKEETKRMFGTIDGCYL